MRRAGFALLLQVRLARRDVDDAEAVTLDRRWDAATANLLLGPPTAIVDGDGRADEVHGVEDAGDDHQQQPGQPDVGRRVPEEAVAVAEESSPEIDIHPY